MDIGTPSQSELFSKLVEERKLPHPTSRGFSPEAWEAAWKALANPTEQDFRLLTGALFYGREIASLRGRFENRLFENIDRRTAKLLSVAMANREFRELQRQAKAQVRRQARGGVARLDGLGGIRISSAYKGNAASPDAITASIVDTLPHCIERANRLPQSVSTTKINFDGQGKQLFVVLSIEHGLRDLWHQVLWGNWELGAEDGKLLHRPVNPKLQEMWVAWIRRLESIAGQGALLDVINNRMRHRLGESLVPFLPETVVGIGGSKLGRRFRFGAQSGRTSGQVRHLSQATIIEESYVGDFIDARLPKLGAVDLSCRMLHKAWCVLRDAADVLRSKTKSERFSDVTALEQHALLVDRKEIERAVAACCNFGAEQAEAAVLFLSIDASETSALFDEGLWSRPLLSIDNHSVAMILPSLIVGSPIRCVEHWLERGGLSDSLSNAGRGVSYESYVRKELGAAIASNSLLAQSRCAPNGVSDGGEQIDLLFRVGGKTIVAEVKCFLGAVESIEQFNYLKKLKQAAEQAVRKAKWIEVHPEIAAKALDIPVAEVNSPIVPIVVTNQGFGTSLKVAGAQVIDFHFLSLYLSKGSYIAGAAFREADRKAAFHEQVLYRSEKEAEVNFESTIASPPSLEAYLNAIVWDEVAFPKSSGGNLLISVCYVGGNLTAADNDDIVAMLDGVGVPESE